MRKSWSTVSNSPGALCRISSSVAGLIPGERTSATPRSVLQVSDRHLRRYPLHTTAYTIGDTVTSTCSALSLDLAAASSWAKTWGMLYNAEKSEHLPINTNGRGNVDMDGTIIPQVTAHRHVGVVLNQKLTWNNHIDNLYTSCARRVGILRRLRNKLQSQVFKKIFIGSIRSKLEYACAVWSGGPITSSSDFKKPSVTGTRYTFHLCRRGSNFTRLSCCSRCVRSFHRGTCHPSCRRQCLHPVCTT